MRLLWTRREVSAPADALWALLATPSRWAEWGPSVRVVDTPSDQLTIGLRGEVTTVVGASLPFEITDLEPGQRWAWKVAGIAATDHVVEPLGPDRCRVGFGVPWAAAPYLGVCRLALARLERLATGTEIAR